MPSLAALFERNVVRINAKVPRADQFQTGLRAPQMEALETDDHDALAVFEGVGRDGDEGLRVDQADKIRRGGEDLAVDGGRQVLVLELDIGAASLVLADAVQHDLAEVEAGPGLPQHMIGSRP